MPLRMLNKCYSEKVLQLPEIALIPDSVFEPLTSKLWFSERVALTSRGHTNMMPPSIWNARMLDASQTEVVYIVGQLADWGRSCKTSLSLPEESNTA